MDNKQRYGNKMNNVLNRNLDDKIINGKLKNVVVVEQEKLGIQRIIEIS